MKQRGAVCARLIDQRHHLPHAVGALADRQARGQRTDAHFTAGLGRTPLTVLSYLAWIGGRSLQEAIQLIHRRRPATLPAWEAHRGCRENPANRHRCPIEQRAHELSQARPPGQSDQEADWLQPQTGVIRSVLTAIDSPADAIVG